MENKIEIYVALLDEGIDVFRPVQAVVIGENKYRLLGLDQYDPDDEIWEFPPGSIVSGKKIRSDKGGEFLAAISIDTG